MSESSLIDVVLAVCIIAVVVGAVASGLFRLWAAHRERMERIRKEAPPL